MANKIADWLAFSFLMFFIALMVAWPIRTAIISRPLILSLETPIPGSNDFTTGKDIVLLSRGQVIITDSTGLTITMTGPITVTEKEE